MKNRTPITYPRNASEARRIFNILESRWKQIIDQDEGRRKGREWIRLAKDANIIYKQAIQKAEAYKAEVKEAKENKSFVKTIGATVNLNFHERMKRQLEKWMKSKRIPF